MARSARPSRTWIEAPAAIVVIVALMLLAGIGVILQSEAAYRGLQQQETRVQADILAASVTAALDFEDAVATHEAVAAISVNPQVRSIGVYNEQGRLVAGYGRDGPAPPSTLENRLPAPESAVSSEVPVTSRGARVGTIYLVTDPEPISRRLSRYLVIALLIVMAALVVIVLGVAQAAMRRANHQLGERADALAEANAELKVQVSERGKAEDQLRQGHKMQALGQLTGGIAHDFNNLLTVILGSADMLRRPGISEDKRIRFADAVVQASGKAAALTGQLLAFARRQPLHPEVIDVNALIRDMTDLLDRTLGERIEVITTLATVPCTVEADRAQLESAVLNIAVNARDAMPNGGPLEIGTAPVTDTERGEMIALSVHDSGSGMDADTLARAFEPFFTTKVTGKGTGLGLSQVYGFASQSGGDVRIDSAPNQGTTVTLLLPRRRGVREKAAGEERRSLERGRAGRILLVEDNDEVGEFAAQLLNELGHEVVRASSGEEALARASAEAFDLVFTDVVMPGMSGLDLAGRLAELHPGLPVILTTGYSDEIAKSGTGGHPVILKPYKPETVASAIRQAMAGGK
jgi:signal transduction histidine kinase